jgi:hypothetical protein
MPSPIEKLYPTVLSLILICLDFKETLVLSQVCKTLRLDFKAFFSFSPVNLLERTRPKERDAIEWKKFICVLPPNFRLVVPRFDWYGSPEKICNDQLDKMTICEDLAKIIEEVKRCQCVDKSSYGFGFWDGRRLSYDEKKRTFKLALVLQANGSVVKHP